MNQVNQQTETVEFSWKLKLGLALFIVSILIPLVGIPVITGLSLSTTLTTTISGAMLMAGEVLGVSSIAFMGKPGFAYIKTRVAGIIKQYGPPQTVSRKRYSIGLFMFILPILSGWALPYVAEYITGLNDHLLIYALTGDVILISSLFILGGDFWDKLSSLFIYDAKAKFRTGHQ
jgi:hypothetical protein